MNNPNTNTNTLFCNYFKYEYTFLRVFEIQICIHAEPGLARVARVTRLTRSSLHNSCYWDQTWTYRSGKSIFFLLANVKA